MLSFVRDSFPLTGRRIDSATLTGSRQALAEQANHILDSVETSDFARSRDGNHLVVDRRQGNQVTQEETWFFPKLPLSVAMYPGEAEDRTSTTRCQLRLEDGRLSLEKTCQTLPGSPDQPDWLATNPAPTSRAGLAGRILAAVGGYNLAG